MKKLFTTMAAAALMMSAANAAMVTWGVNADFGGTAQITGTVTFDDPGFVDGDFDINDTHVYGDFDLSSVELGWDHLMFNGWLFQSFYNAAYGDGPHIDYSFTDGAGNSAYLYDYNTGYLTDAAGSQTVGKWSFDRNVEVPEPATVALLGAGLLGLGLARRRKQQAA